MTTRCTFCCGPTTSQCPSFLSYLGEFLCTRPAGHGGPHVACHPSLGRHQIRTWQPTMDDAARDLAAACASAEQHPCTDWRNIN